MFQKILQWIKEMIGKMIGQTDIKKSLGVDVAYSTEMASALQTWSDMYSDKANWLTADIRSAGLPAGIAGTIARAVTIEMKVEITGSARAAYLSKQMETVLSRIRGNVEKGCAKGGLIMKPYVNGDTVAVDFVQADCFYPVNFDADGNLTACVFSYQKTIGDKYYTRMELHRMTGGGCQIVNKAFRSTTRDTLGSEVPLAEVEEWAGLLPEAMVNNIKQPLYGYFKFPLANNVDANSPLGVSCYSRAVDLIKEADRLWSSLLWEFDSGKRALYVDSSAFDKGKDGKPIIPDRRLYRTLNQMNDPNVGEEGFFEAWSPEFRDASIKNGLNTILQRIEFACGLAYGTLSDPQSVEKTATEIAASRQSTYATITDTQKALKTALEQLIYAMDVYATLYGLAPSGSYSTAFDFDDSIVVDKGLQFQQDMRLVTAGLMSKTEFRMRNFGEDEATAKKRIAEVQVEQPQDVFQQAQGA